MAKRFAVEERIFNKYQKIASETLKGEIRKKVIRKLKDNIKATVYSKPDPKYYTRSYSMMNSVRGYVTRDNDLQTIISIYPDPSNMTGFPDPKFKNYLSLAGMGSDDNRDMIVEWLNEGTSGSPIYNHPAHKFMDKTADEAGIIARGKLNKALYKASKRK